MSQERDEPYGVTLLAVGLVLGWLAVIAAAIVYAVRLTAA